MNINDQIVVLFKAREVEHGSLILKNRQQIQELLNKRIYFWEEGMEFESIVETELEVETFKIKIFIAKPFAMGIGD